MTDSIPAATNAVTATPTAAIHNKAHKVKHSESGESHSPPPAVASTTVTLSAAAIAAAAADKKPAETPTTTQGGRGNNTPMQPQTSKTN